MPARMLIETGEEMRKRIDAYFRDKDDVKEPASVHGMALACGVHTEIFLSYEYEAKKCGCKEEDCEKCLKGWAIKEGKNRIVKEWMPFLRGTTPTGTIYYLKTMGLWDTPAAIALTQGKDGEPVAGITITFNTGDKEDVSEAKKETPEKG